MLPGSSLDATLRRKPTLLEEKLRLRLDVSPEELELFFGKVLRDVDVVVAEAHRVPVCPPVGHESFAVQTIRHLPAESVR